MIADPVRLAALHATGLLDSEIEEVFDRLTHLAARLVNVPASFISLIDADRDFYKSAYGFGEPLASSRELAGTTFCHFTLNQGAPLVIADTAGDPRYRDVPTVKTLGVAAYVGVPLMFEGQHIGAFCAIDNHPRAWTKDEVGILVELASSAQREIDLRRAIALARSATNAAESRREDAERSSRLLQEQALELELQAEELQTTTAHLEERTEAAEAANKAKVNFLSMMSHELRTPLNAIGGYAELISMAVCGPVTPQQVDYLGRVKRASQHLQTLIGDILEFTHLDAGQGTYVVETLKVDRIVFEAAELIMPQITEAGITFSHVSCAPNECLVLAEERKLRQILINLLTNALKFTSAAGTITVHSETSAEISRISVTDTGRGIPASEHANIFEPFVQVDREQTIQRNQGVGLGLAICRQLARGMGGDLHVTSTVGVGSTFTLTLPAPAGTSHSGV